jgi:two-component system, cell cycle response regulator
MESTNVSKSKILIVDDEPEGRYVLEQLLALDGHELLTAGSGPEAIQIAKERRPDLILLDVMMPDMNGFEVCRKLREQNDTSMAPVIMITALDDRESRLKGLECGADDFLTKPYDWSELQARTSAILRLNRYRRLCAEKERFAWLVECSQDGCVLLDSQERIEYANPQARLFLGLEGKDSAVKGGNFLEIIEKRYHLEPRNLWVDWKNVSERDASLYLVRPETQDSRAFWLQVDIFPSIASEGFEYVIRLKDVTSEINAQSDMRNFHNIISHKLRTPLSSLLGYLEILNSQLEGDDEEVVATLDDSREFSKVALKSAQRLHYQIKDILSYIAAPTLAMNGETCSLENVESLAQEIARELVITQNQIQFSYGLGVEPSRMNFKISKQCLELALWELLENSKKFHPSHQPSIRIGIELESREALDLSIQDDGIHLSPEQLAQVWAPYFQGEKFFTGEAHGMGLGLSGVAAMIWKAGGQCRMINREDVPGVIVQLKIPCSVEG